MTVEKSKNGSSKGLSVIIPVQPSDMDLPLAFAQLVQETGARRLWMGQSLQVESFSTFAYMAGAGCRISTGLGVGLTALRSPYTAAVEARSIAALTGRSMVTGFGPAYPQWVQGIQGTRYRSPRVATVEYLSIVRDLLRGAAVDHKGEYFTVKDSLPPLEHPPVEVGAGVLRPLMAESVGEVADAAITWMTPANYVAEQIVPALSRGAVKAGQDSPRVVTVVHAAVRRPGRDPRILARKAAQHHLRLPHYVDMLNKAGLEVNTEDTVSAARELVDEGVFAYGEPWEIIELIQEYYAAGVDEVVIHVGGVLMEEGLNPALKDAAEIIEEEKNLYG